MEKDQNQSLSYEQMIASLEAKKIAFTKAIDDAIESLKRVHSLDPVGSLPAAPSSNGQKGNIEVRHDTFYNLSVVEAGVKYLGMVREAKHLKDILAALRKGNVKVTDQSAETLFNKRAREEKDLVKVGRNIFGLKSWY